MGFIFHQRTLIIENIPNRESCDIQFMMILDGCNYDALEWLQIVTIMGFIFHQRTLIIKNIPNRESCGIQFIHDVR